MKMTNEIDSLIVPVSEYTFSRANKNKIYYYPRARQPTKNIRYVFFYIVKPIQAITHYGIIKKHVKDADDMIDLLEKMRSFKDPTKEASAYKFSKIIPLKSKVRFDSNAPTIQNRVYGNHKKIIALKTTKGLFKQGKNGKLR